MQNCHITKNYCLCFYLNWCCSLLMPSYWKVESQVLIHMSHELICHIFSLHSFLWWKKKSPSDFFDILKMKGTFKCVWCLFRWVCPPSHINVNMSKIVWRGGWWDRDRRLFCQFDIQVTYFCFSMFTLWLLGELREALSPACQNQAGKLSQHRWRHIYHLGVCRWHTFTQTHAHKLYTHRHKHLLKKW